MRNENTPNDTDHRPAVGGPVERPVMQHSPGPWKFNNDPGEARTISDARGISLMGDEQYYPWAPSEEADWRLIAAAPELLAPSACGYSAHFVAPPSGLYSFSPFAAALAAIDHAQHAPASSCAHLGSGFGKQVHTFVGAARPRTMHRGAVSDLGELGKHDRPYRFMSSRRHRLLRRAAPARRRPGPQPPDRSARDKPDPEQRPSWRPLLRHGAPRRHGTA